FESYQDFRLVIVGLKVVLVAGQQGRRGGRWISRRGRRRGWGRGRPHRGCLIDGQRRNGDAERPAPTGVNHQLDRPFAWQVGQDEGPDQGQQLLKGQWFCHDNPCAFVLGQIVN